MKRDFDLLRQILLTAENLPPESSLSNSKLLIEGYSPDVISAHVQLLHEAGFIAASISKEIGPVPRGFHVYRLTWSGHEFLDAIRDTEVWRKTKATAASKGAALTFELVKAIATAYVKVQLGLS
jgi:DNA-binding HxlR family transcriptional regulator